MNFSDNGSDIWDNTFSLLGFSPLELSFLSLTIKRDLTDRWNRNRASSIRKSPQNRQKIKHFG